MLRNSLGVGYFASTIALCSYEPSYHHLEISTPRIPFCQ